MSEFSRPAEDFSQSTKEYIDLKIDDIKLRSVKGLSVTVGKLLALILILGVASSLVLVLSFGLILLLGELMGSYAWAALIVAAILAVSIVPLWLMRDKMFQKGFVKLFIKMFFGGDDDKELS